MGNILTDEWSVRNVGISVFIVLWFVGWAKAAQNMMKRTEQERQEMVHRAAQEIQAQKEKFAKQRTAEHKKSK